MTLKFFSLVSMIMAFAIGQPAQSQSMTAADIQAQVDQKVAGMNEYQKLLNDPDPDRSLAAMQIMLGSGDTELTRMALDYGLFSPNPVVQRSAIEALLQAQPVLSIYVEKHEDDSNGSWSYYAAQAEGSVLSDGRVFRSNKVGTYDPEQSCFLWAGSKDTCMIRVSDHGVSARLWGKWHSLSLDDQGQLVGSGAYPESRMPVKTVIPLSQ